MSLNQLYALLTTDAPPVSSSDAYYVKYITPCIHTERSKALLHVLTSSVPPARLRAFACVLCSNVRYSGFGAEILALDADNTYHRFVRDPSATGMDIGGCIYDLTGAVDDFAGAARQYLDNDIVERLSSPNWMEVAAACCLQMLREAVHDAQ